MSVTSIPFRLGSVSIIGKTETAIIEALLEICPELAWQIMIQSGSKKCVEKCMTRQNFVCLERKSKNKLFKFVYDTLDNNIPGICSCRDMAWKDRNIYSYITSTTLPMLERLASVAMQGQQIKLIHLLIKLIDTDAIHEYRVLESLMRAVMKQASENSKADMLNELLECSAKSRFHIEEDGQLDPFDVFTFKKQTLPLFKSKNIDTNLIEELFRLTEKTEIERKVAFARLGQLCEWGNLTSDQGMRFGKALWSKTNPKTKFPDMDNYYIFVYMKWPRPMGIEVESLLRNYFIDEERLHRIKNNFHIRTVQNVPFYNDLIRVNEEKEYVWTKDEMNIIMRFLLDLWNKGKEEMDEKKATLEFEINNFNRVFHTWVRVVASFSEVEIRMMSDELRRKTYTCLGEMTQYNIAVYEEELFLLEKNELPLFQRRLIDSLYDTDKNQVLSTVQTIERCMFGEISGEHKTMLFEELAKFIRARKEPGLSEFLISVHNILYQNTEKLPVEILELIHKALLAIEKQTKYEDNLTSEYSIKKAIEIRSHCASVAYQLYRYENKYCAEQPHSKAVKLWNDICTGRKSENEFTEVKNNWIIA